MPKCFEKRRCQAKGVTKDQLRKAALRQREEKAARQDPARQTRATNRSKSLVDEFSDQPQVAERIHDGTLKHPADRAWTCWFVLVFQHRTVLGFSCGQGLLVHTDRVAHEELDPHRRKARGGSSS